MHIQLTGNRHELDTFLRDFRTAFHGRYLIGHYIDSTYACTTAVCAGRNSDDGHVHHGFAVIGPPPPEIDPHERLDAIADRLVDIGVTPVKDIARRLVESGASVTIETGMTIPDGPQQPTQVTLVHAAGSKEELTLAGPANGPQQPSEVTSTGPDGVTQKLTPDADGWYEVPCDEGAPTHPGPCCDNPGPQP
jgi:hypothetical protein